jgi:hypothetical protein
MDSERIQLTEQEQWLKKSNPGLLIPNLLNRHYKGIQPNSSSHLPLLLSLELFIYLSLLYIFTFTFYVSPFRKNIEIFYVL